MIKGDDLRRFESKYIPEPNTGCWLWLDYLYPNGYGHFRRGRKMMGAHRAAYELFVGEIGEFFVCHRCDVRHCVNPDHLFLGTPKDNSADMAKKKRAARQAGDDHPQSKLTTEDVITIRRSPLTAKELGKVYGVHSEHIRAIRKRKTWRHVA